MPRPTLVMIHTVARTADDMRTMCRGLIPAATVLDIVDSALLSHVLAEGHLTPLAYRRLCDDVVFAAECGADVVLVTCSSLSPCVDAARLMVQLPVLKIDEPMAELAVQLGTRIGVIATVPTTLKPTSDLVAQQAQRQGRTVKIQAVLCAGAFERLMAGDMTSHDQIVLGDLRDLLQRSDVVVLAQASMARVADQLTADEKKVPVLSSPRLGLERAVATLQAGAH